MRTLPVERIEDDRPTTAITLVQYKLGLTRDQQIMCISLMMLEVNDFFNVKGKMTAKQIRLTAELILDNPAFYDLTLGNIKACFRQKMMSEKLYDRLDGNIIIGWLREFKSRLADHCENANLGRDRKERNGEAASGAISHTVYLAMLQSRAEQGDEDAKRTLAEYEKRSHVTSEEERRRKEYEWFKYKAEYLQKMKEKQEREAAAKRNDI